MAEWERLVAGAVAAGCAEVVTLPLDCIKTRLQNQTSPPSTSRSFVLVTSRSFNVNTHRHVSTSAGTADVINTASRLMTLRAALRQEKPKQWFQGIHAALARQISYTSIRMVLYDPIRTLCERSKTSDQPTFLHHFVAGGLAGAIGIAIANPFDVVKVRMQCDRSGTLHRRGIMNSLTRIARKEGLRALTNGMLPNVQRAFVVNAAELGSYDQCKHMLESIDPTIGEHVRHFVASGVAGFVSAVASNPLDVVKTRLMMHEAACDRRRLSMTKCLRRTLHHEGPSALFKGFWPNFARKGPWCMVFFFLYEQTQRRLQLLTDCSREQEQWSL